MITFLKRCMWFVVLFVLFCWDLVVSSVLVAATVISPCASVRSSRC